jgi:hypothetical protein
VFSPDGQCVLSGSNAQTIRLWEVATGQELVCLDRLGDSVPSLAVSSDGKLLAAAVGKVGVLLWDMETLGQGPPPARFDKEQLLRWQRDLGSADAQLAYRAVTALSAAGEQTLPLLKENLRPVPVVKPERIRQLIADLNHDDFERREAASRELARLRPAAESALRKALAESPGAEARRRIEAILPAPDDWQVTDPDTLSAIRSTWVLQRIGTPAAKAILCDLASGAPEARLTRHARTSLALPNRRLSSKP